MYYSYCSWPRGNIFLKTCHGDHFFKTCHGDHFFQNQTQNLIQFLQFFKTVCMRTRTLPYSRGTKRGLLYPGVPTNKGGKIKNGFLAIAKSSNIRDFLAANSTVVLKFSTAVLHFSTTNSTSSRSKFS